MKSNKSYLSHFFLLFAIAFGGCKASTSPTGTTTTPGSMIATVNGNAWSSTIITGISGGAKAEMKGSVLTVTGISATDNTQITLAIINPSKTTDSLGGSGDEGTYSHIIGIADTTVYASIPNMPLNSIYDGSVTISSYDTTAKTISGSFHFIGRLAKNLADTVTVTNGSFYQVGW